MFDCKCLIHPFQTDPGISQRQRVMDDLLSGAATIDGRSMADLLDFFMQLSQHVNFYRTDLSIGNWQPFFQKSIPFSLTAIIKFNTIATNKKLDAYSRSFGKHPSKAGIQLLLHFFYQQFVNRINTWHLDVKGSGLPVELALEKLIQDKLQEPLKHFIELANAAKKWYCVESVDCIHPEKLSRLYENTVWDLDVADLYTIDETFRSEGVTKRQRMRVLYQKINDLAPVFLDSIRVIATTAEQSMEQSFFPLKEELKKNHPPHLALLFAFLKLFQHLQKDLNSFTKKHLDYFYQQVLKIKPRAATADKAHLVFDIQKQLNQYLLKKGLLTKDGKDVNKAEILFALDDELVVNKTQVVDKRTLFINNQSAFGKTYIEGVYMAPDATKADGVEKDFKDDNPKSFPTLGAKFSKYTHPEKTLPQPHPNARIAFILASPVLLLQEGTRTIQITLACELKRNYCGELQEEIMPVNKNCCEENNGNDRIKAGKNPYEDFIGSESFYSDVAAALNETYYYISEDLLQQATKKGLSKDLENDLRKFLIDTQKLCYCPEEVKKYERVIVKTDWDNFYNAASPAEKLLLDELFKPRKALTISFSGEKEWIAPKIDPAQPSPISITPLSADNKFLLKINTTLTADQPAVTFYDKEKLKEDFNTTIPLVKIEMDDKVKLMFTNDQLESKIENKGPVDKCCLLKKSSGADHHISLYHFFRNVVVVDEVNTEKTRIHVSVCGLRNFIVQNDESVQDVNAPIYAFGARPKVNANFFIGSEEIFSKNWEKVWVNAYWKDYPAEGFANYYNGYQNEYRDTNGIIIKKTDQIKDDDFLMKVSFLQDGTWFNKNGAKVCSVDNVGGYDSLFPAPTLTDLVMCFQNKKENFDALYTHQYQFSRGDFQNLPLKPKEKLTYAGLKRMDVNTRHCFLRLTLKCQDFQHDRYSIVLARQLEAEAKLPNLTSTAVYYNVNSAGDIQVVDIDQMFEDIKDARSFSDEVRIKLSSLISEILSLIRNQTPDSFNITINDVIWQALFNMNLPTFPFFPPLPVNQNNLADSTLWQKFLELHDLLVKNSDLISGFQSKGVVIPNEPWTPIIKYISLDYTATAFNTDIDLIHLYPFKDTYKHEEIELQPTLFPTFCDEGTLFVGLKDLVPGNNLNILFQLAEATADSESDREDLRWHYLDNNVWKELRTGFEVLDDATDDLTTSGIVQFSLPENMTRDNSIMLKDLHWIKAAIPRNSKVVSETIDIHTQAIRVTFNNDDSNDKLRLGTPLPAGSISKLAEPDANVRKVSQPYDSFGGRVPEAEGHFYTRVSELLRHKGRAIQKFDYERLALEAFPQIFKAKCINHSFALNGHQYTNDFPIAPGYVLLAVIPDLNQLKAGHSFEPRAPVSLLDDVQQYLQKRTSPFVRLRVMNPRYEKVHFCLKLKLLPGKDENYYREKLKQDLREFLAPWSVGQYEKLSFGQCINRSDIVQFLETSDYMDYLLELKMEHEFEVDKNNPVLPAANFQVCPKTPRSILIAGDIDVCIPEEKCEEWGEGYCPKRELLVDYCKDNQPG